tara:strand:+ start:1911 stop:2090 length:180 start_codon:yes stop_codon:yes gene_type:complete
MTKGDRAKDKEVTRAVLLGAKVFFCGHLIKVSPNTIINKSEENADGNLAEKEPKASQEG